MCSERSKPRLLRTPKWATSEAESKVPRWDAGQQASQEASQGACSRCCEGIGHILPLPSEWLLHSSGTALVVTGMSHTSAKGRPFGLAPVLKRRDPPEEEEKRNLLNIQKPILKEMQGRQAKTFW